MAVRIRLSRGGSKKRPFYKIVVADKRAPRDGRFIEKVGTYNPLLPREHAERTVINEERVKYWLSVGGQPTDRVARMFAEKGLMEKPAISTQSKKPMPRAKTLERIKQREEEAAKAVAEAAKTSAENA